MMNKFFTQLQRNDPERISREYTVGYSSTDFDMRNNQGEQFVPEILPFVMGAQEDLLGTERTIYSLIGKRILDLLISGFVFVFVLSWLFPVIGALILTESPGPILFIQPRSGRKGKSFPCLKFRTMRNASSPQADFQQTARGDKRVTAIGSFLRRTNLDEVPQFINVLLGHMSIVGPRPHAVQHDALHWASPSYRQRYVVKPGITGLAQIRGARGATDTAQKMNQRVRYDHFYIPRQSFWFDMKICYKTLMLMVKGDTNAW
ncbi:sugar transferase [Spirosoma sp. KNUC1025]|uniref:sugar transferase n=1 Tax=Spirosoma sp. KNUC1025 TaxID=2894082 RepID=UPI00386812CE|nr:sugar transferase [Spirosoma sp. KNUC1025]